MSSTPTAGANPTAGPPLRRASAIRGFVLGVLLAVGATLGVLAWTGRLTTPTPPAKSPDLMEALRKAADSVYLVVLRHSDGAEFAYGTAWVAGPSLLATNAHVAQAFGELAPGQTLLVRSGNEPVRDFVVDRADLHPAFSEFFRTLLGYGPLERVPGGFRPLRRVTAFDVALMHVSSAAGLAPPLRIRSGERLAALRAGDEVGYVGYPVENAALGGVNLNQPTPITHLGRLLSATDYFLNRDASGQNHLLRHDLPGAGGCSGSPILAADGEVVGVFSGGDVAISIDGMRISTGAAMNHAQRADAVTELLEGKAAEKSAGRKTEWLAALRRFPSSREVFKAQHEEILGKIVATWIGTSGRKPVQVRAVDGVLGPPDRSRPRLPGAHVADFEFLDMRVFAGKERLVVAICHTNDDINLSVYRSGLSNAISRTKELDDLLSLLPDPPLAEDNSPNSYPAVHVPDAAHGLMHVRVTGPADGLAFTLYVYAAE